MSEMVRALAERAGPQGLKPRSSAGCCGTAEAVPLSETVGMSATAGEEQMPGFFAPLRMTSEEEEDATPFDKLREECGVMAIYGHPDAARMTYWGLYALQHRGQESAGIAAADGTDVTD